MKNVAKAIAVTCLAAGAAFAQAQQANPTPGCSVTPAQLEANRKVAISFFDPATTYEQKLALIGPGYKQHNPGMVKEAAEKGISDPEEIQNTLKRLFGPGGQLVGGGRGRGNAPPGNQFEIVTAECDIVTMVHLQNRPDPTAEGKFYQAFTFDTFRIKDGKLVEHWDNAVINPPAPAGRGQ
jgi:predicted SnoaL-like aldol condensation-catalyzing enzyme